MKPLKVAGRYIPCQACRRHHAKTDAPIPLCGRCIRPFMIGFLSGRMG